MLRDRWLFGRKTRVFTVQWHLTNRCPFHCRHCYDRSARDDLNLIEVRQVLADTLDFCRKKRVRPQFSLSGGDPLIYPHFWDLYGDIAKVKVPVSILGNPIPAPEIQRLMEVQTPIYYQVSLEGLSAYNDEVRGSGHFERTMAFLAQARALGLETHVMLTLTRANLDQVIPLGTLLRGLTGRFTFNRLAQVGQAVDLEPPSQADYKALLEEYINARRNNPVFGFKDNLFNILRHTHNQPMLPGCTGFGCGAAFNFVALLPDGEVHACRKFPSRIGNIRENKLAAIYHSAEARSYRGGSLACRKCRLRRSCGGCLAVTYGRGGDPLRERDPDCFMPRTS